MLLVRLLNMMFAVSKVQRISTVPISALSVRYFKRLGLDPSKLDAKATLDKLKILHERHLACIPFENASQHGLDHAAALDVQQTAHKILDRTRGGFCFEVNGLLAAFLVELGYKVVQVPAQVYGGTHFDVVPSHLVLIVTCHDGTVVYADVGFGEPPLHPLLYDVSGDVEQVTPEGMRSKLVRQTDEQGEAVYLYWFKNGEWIPRLRWNYPCSIKKKRPLRLKCWNLWMPFDASCKRGLEFLCLRVKGWICRNLSLQTQLFGLKCRYVTWT